MQNWESSCSFASCSHSPGQTEISFVCVCSPYVIEESVKTHGTARPILDVGTRQPLAWLVEKDLFTFIIFSCCSLTGKVMVLESFSSVVRVAVETSESQVEVELVPTVEIPTCWPGKARWPRCLKRWPSQEKVQCIKVSSIKSLCRNLPCRHLIMVSQMKDCRVMAWLKDVLPREAIFQVILSDFVGNFFPLWWWILWKENWVNCLLHVSLEHSSGQVAQCIFLAVLLRLV